MFKKIAIGISCMLTVTAGALLAGCGETPDYDELYADKVKVVYELEGGKYLNSETNVSHYYDYRENLKIFDLSNEAFSKGGVTRDGGYTLEGWYRTKTVGDDGTVTYSGLWDFDKDFVTKEGVTLYAKWNPKIVYSYDLFYIDGGEEKLIKSFTVPVAGTAFGALYKPVLVEAAEARPGYTAVAAYYGYKDGEYSKPFDDSVVHGEEGGSIKIYVEYLQGEYTVVSTAEQLSEASTKSKSIYLAKDIDMEGKALSFDKFRGKEFAGNGYTVSNFTLDYKVTNSLTDVDNEGNRDAFCISLFGTARNLKVTDVIFGEMTVKVAVDFSQVKRIYVAPLAITATNSSFEKVTVSCTYTVEELPEESTRLIWVTDRGVYSSNSDGTEKDCHYEITAND